MKLGLALPSEASATVLALGAHPDDVELGCAGTLLQLRDLPGTSIHTVVLTGTPERAQEAAAAAEATSGPQGSFTALQLPDGRLPACWAQVKDALEAVAEQVRPDLVLAPRLDDAHQDHRTLAEVVPTVFRGATVLGYEIHKLDGDRGRCNVYVPMPPEVLDAKWGLLDEHFSSQRARAWWDRDVVAGLARLRGVEARARYAEGFWSSKLVLELTG